jgi:transcriptional regulator with XRE-family HTH domain
MKTYEKLGQNIKRQRVKKGLTQEELALMCNYSDTYMGFIERAQRKIGVDSLVNIANKLEVGVDYLLGDCIEYSGKDRAEKINSYIGAMDSDMADIVVKIAEVVKEGFTEGD